MTDERTARIRHTPALWLISFAFWTVAVSLNAGSELIDLITGDQAEAVWEPILWEASSNYVWAVLTPFIVVFALRHPFARENWPRRLGLYALVLVGFSLAHVFGMVGIREFVYWVVGYSYAFGDTPIHFALEILYELFKDAFTFVFVVTAAYAFDFYRQWQERKLRAAQLETQLARARLENLKQQLQPHFLFNTLNTVSSVMHENVRLADTILTKLSDLLRLTMEKGERQEVPLQEELESLQLYIEIMSSRFHDRLKVELDIDPGARDALVPVFILQPLVENAIKHGVAPRPEGGRVFVRAQRRNGGLRLEVRDDGPGSHEAAEALLERGFGLSSSLERVERLYGKHGKSRVENGPEGGLAITLDLPYRREDGGGGKRGE